MTNRKRAGVAAGLGIGAAAAAALRRRRGDRRREPQEIPGTTAGADAAGAAFLDHLAEAVRIPTVVYEESDRTDTAAFDRFHEFLWTTFPRTFGELHPEVVAGHTLLLRWDGSDPAVAPVLLMAHMDVVPVEPGTEGDWEHPPFSAERDGEFLWGRGAVDDKGSLVALLEAVEGLLSEGFEPDATLYLVLGHDEEIGGGEGARAAAALLAERGVSVEFVLDEGGAVVEDLLPGVRTPVALLGIGEKGYVNVEISASDAGGHSSTPPPSTAVGRVAAAVAALEADPMPARLSAQEGLFAVIGRVVPGLQGAVLRRAGRFGSLVERKLAARPQSNALIRTTAAVTMVSGGVKPNVLPQHASAIVNFRVLPGDSFADVLDHVRRVAGPEVTVRPLPGGFTAEPSPLSDTTSAGYRLIADTIADTFGGVEVAPWILMGATDSRHFIPVADNVYRFAPFTMTPEDMGRVHGTGERLRLADAGRAVAFYTTLVRRACGTV
jgi:carboxypeptidase PM20D1